MRMWMMLVLAGLLVASCDSGGDDGETCLKVTGCEGGEDSLEPRWDSVVSEDTTSPCYPQCADKLCGDDGCGGSCGDCEAGWGCTEAFVCEELACVPECEGMVCGEDGCGGVCGYCLGAADCVDGACVEPDMILLMDANFWMGCNDVVDNACAGDEYPYHEVFLQAYEIDKYEVTVSAYAQCMGAGSCGEPEGTQETCNYGKGGRHEHPVNCVSWNQAKAYCEYAGKRLCTAAEWERAARGHDGNVYPWGHETPTCETAVMTSGATPCSSTGTAPVGSVPAGMSPSGVHDMAGNVSEWVGDWYLQDYYYQAPSNDPKGPINGSEREFRGGGFNGNPMGLRCSMRDHTMPIVGYPTLGIRCCR
jgi:formylglycine-generating enzyme